MVSQSVEDEASRTMDKLAQEIKSGKTILFVGAGVSATVKLPTYRQLIAKIAQEIGFDPEVFTLLGNFQVLAEFYSLEKRGDLIEFYEMLDKEWHDTSIDIRNSEIHNLIAGIPFPVIYTTNYDRWLERSYEHNDIEYSKVVSVCDIPNSQVHRRQIIKFHGDFDAPESIVLTESDYFERLNLETPMDIKLQADILGKSLLFIGYSLSDINIRYLLYRINKLWVRSGYERFKPTSYIFLSRPNPVEETIFKKRGIVPIRSDSEDETTALRDFLEVLRKRVNQT